MNIILLSQHCLQLPDNSANENSPLPTAIISDKAVIQHLLTVLNIQRGDTLKIGIENGKLGTAIIENIVPNAIFLHHIDCQMPPPKKLDFTVVLALPRPKVLRRLIMDMTAMGVQRLILVNSYHTEKSYWQSPMLARTGEFIREGLQQACDTVPMLIEQKKRLKPFVEDELPLLLGENVQAIVAHPYTEKSFNEVWKSHQSHILIVGAEGGWLPYEVGLFLAQGCEVASLGSRILRTENVVSVLCGRALLG